jgi:hypothetical protein
MRVLSFFGFQVNYMLYWPFHFEKEIPVNCLFTQWKWTYILDVGPWKRSALDMGYMDEQPSRMQGSGQGRGRPGSRDWGSGFFGVAPARHSNACNARRGYLESPVMSTTMWVKIAYKTQCLFWEVVRSVAQMKDPNWGANIFHIKCPI